MLSVIMLVGGSWLIASLFVTTLVDALGYVPHKAETIGDMIECFMQFPARLIFRIMEIKLR